MKSSGREGAVATKSKQAASKQASKQAKLDSKTPGHGGETGRSE